MNLRVDRFEEFFRACHKHTPFPWQTALTDKVLAEGWPSAISLPTASGKTAVLDIAVFALACEATDGVARGTMPRRIALVVDRRIVVDDAFRRALRIRDALCNAKSGILRDVADALKTLGGELPLDVAQLRGGIYREDRWARTPAQPVILCSTVDQVGSRLLHRGYGLSSAMWPVHAGLLGNDCLIVLDEAHCSEPFRQTLEWVEKFRAKAGQPLTSPFKTVTMTATPRSKEAPYVLTTADYGHPELKKRIEARKLAALHVCGKKDAEFAKKALEQVRALAEPGRTTLVVVNRVNTAREIRDLLGKTKEFGETTILLTGRSRSLDRDRMLKQWEHRLMAGRKRADVAAEPPLVVVATQCVEVGADLDVDALVTECCSFDAIRQRFGRLDRLGELGETHAAILVRDNQAEDEPDDDPIYGKALSRTWQWLAEQKGDAKDIDLGIAALDGMPDRPGRLPNDRSERAKLLEPLTAPTADAPIVFPAYCDLWAQTGPEPAVSPEPAIFLHGPQRGEPEVRIVWRADLDGDAATWADIVSLCPPVSGEAMPLPISLARKWLTGELAEAQDTGDVESARSDDEDSRKQREPTIMRLVLRWRGPDGSEIARKPGDIRPGDTLVVPVTYGGCDAEGWNPKARTTADAGDEARIRARRPAVLRLHPAMNSPESLAQWGTFRDEEWSEDADEQLERLRQGLEEVRTDERIGKVCDLLLRAGKRMRIHPHPSGRGLVLSCDLRPEAVDAPDFSDEDDTAAHGGGNVKLGPHLADVEKRVREMLKDSGLSVGIVEDVALAARFHDVGKADPRFQALLAGGDRGRAIRGGLLAKSARMPTDRATLAEKREASGYPIGGRHELLSVRLVESAPTLLDKAHDKELVLHLIESHHGHCRPFAPVVFDDKPPTVRVPPDVAGVAMAFDKTTGLERLDSGVADRFWNLVRRYGWWGLSYLETCLRLADHRASENPEHAEIAR
jgi:CRISPR-associated endonuclease/helicase Cas3